jgi:hypothetical protein
MYKLFATTALLALVAGCATFDSRPVRTADAGITLEVASTALVFRDVRIETTPQGTSQVTGTLRRIGRRPVRAGHIDYRLTDVVGRVLEQGNGSDGGATGRPHPGRTSQFVIPLHTPWIPGQHRLYLKWHAAANVGLPS